MKRHIVLGLFIVIIATCQGQYLEYGTVIDTIWSKSNSKHSYSLYVPKNYTKDKKWPVLIGLEPAARGSLPTEKYASLFEKYGIIFICSNVSRNGPMEIINESFDVMYNDIFEMFNIDKKQIYTTGFSGGARACMWLAMDYYPDINSIIACGAGLAPGKTAEDKFNFNYYALSGYKDMNYLIIRELDEELTKKDVTNFFSYYNDGHFWPPVKYYEEAIQWILLKNKKTKTNIDTVQVKGRFNKMVFELDTIPQEDYLQKDYQLRKIINFFDGVYDVSSFKKAKNQLNEMEEFKKQVENRQRVIENEMKLEKIIIDEYFNITLTAITPIAPIKDTIWFRNYINNIYKIKEEKNPDYDFYTSDRIIDLMWRNAWIQASNYYNTRKCNTSIIFMHICKMIKNEVAWPEFLISKYYLCNGEYENGVKHLQLAVKKGLNNKMYIINDEAFEPFLKNKEFKAILNQIDNSE